MAMGLQLAQIASQIKVNDSVAEKNKAEAVKTAGVDTEAANTLSGQLVVRHSSASASRSASGTPCWFVMMGRFPKNIELFGARSCP